MAVLNLLKHPVTISHMGGFSCCMMSLVAYPEKWAHCEVVQKWLPKHFLSLVSTINNLLTIAMPRYSCPECHQTQWHQFHTCSSFTMSLASLQLAIRQVSSKAFSVFSLYNQQLAYNSNSKTPPKWNRCSQSPRDAGSWPQSAKSSQNDGRVTQCH